MKRNIPTRIVETGRLVRGSSGQGVGWLQPLVDRARNLKARIQGLQDRLSSNLADGFPSAVLGERTFIADTTSTITIQDYPVEPDQLGGAMISLQVNPIFLAGQTYRIPIIFTPPGVLYATGLVVGIETGFTTFAGKNRIGIDPLPDYRQVRLEAGSVGSQGFVDTDPRNGVIRYTYQQQVLGNFARVIPFMPYFWNIIDEKSGRQYAQDWMPHGALLNTRFQAPVDGVPVPDSELFEFDAPWLIERDGQVSFLFRPLMDLYQISANDRQYPFGNVDDLTGGRRSLQATVRVEFHGNRYYTAQDVLKDGAHV